MIIIKKKRRRKTNAPYMQIINGKFYSGDEQQHKVIIKKNKNNK